MIRLAVLIAVLAWLILSDVIGDIGGFLTSPFRKVGDLAKAVWKALKRLYSWAESIFHHVGGAWAALDAAYHVIISGLERVAEGTYGTLRWITRTIIPKSIRNGIAKAFNSVLNQAKALVRGVRNFAKDVLKFAKKGIKTVAGTLHKVERALRRLIGKALTWIEKAGKRTADLVLHPKRLVTWIMPHLVTPLARWILSHLTALATLIFRWFFSNVGKFVRDIETVIARIF